LLIKIKETSKNQLNI